MGASAASLNPDVTKFCSCSAIDTTTCTVALHQDARKLPDMHRRASVGELCEDSKGGWHMCNRAAAPFEFADSCQWVGSNDDEEQLLDRSWGIATRGCAKGAKEKDVTDFFEDSLFISDGDDPLLVRSLDLPLKRPQAGSSPSASLAQEDLDTDGACVKSAWLFEDQANFMLQHQGCSSVEFLARAHHGPEQANHESALRLSVYYNDGRLLAEGRALAASFKLFHFSCDQKEPVWCLMLVVEQEGQAGGCVELDMQFGLRVRGIDIMPALHKVEDAAEHTAILPTLGPAVEPHALEEVRNGVISMPGSYLAEVALELIVCGLTGTEVLDVFVNGMTVPCQADLRLERVQEPRMLRYVLAPASMTLRNVVIRLRRSGDKENQGGAGGASWGGGVFINSNFGVRVSGQDCLQSVVLLDANTGQRNPHGWDCDSKEMAHLQAGRWFWEGCYFLLPYRRKRKPRGIGGGKA